MALDPKLLEILACPKDKGPLLYFQDEDALYNPRLRLRYHITDDIPVMLIDEADDIPSTTAFRSRFGSLVSAYRLIGYDPGIDYGFVGDMDEKSIHPENIKRLMEAGVSFHCPPIDFSGIAKATYGRDPDGNVFELREIGGALGSEEVGNAGQP